jgi:hypothetical protein
MFLLHDFTAGGKLGSGSLERVFFLVRKTESCQRQNNRKCFGDWGSSSASSLQGQNGTELLFQHSLEKQ